MLDLTAVRINWLDALDIGVVAFIFYRLMLLARGTRAFSMLTGLLFVFVVNFISEEMQLYTLNWLLTNFLSSIILVIVILFQQDIRKALSEFGAGSLWRKKDVQENTLNELVSALDYMAKKRIGALVVIEKNVALGDIIERGVALGSKLTRELLVTIFFPNTPLHDGAVVIRNGRIIAAACILPLTAGTKLQSELGTRHRAAIGISEESDAIAIVVSEERGEISVAIGGKLSSRLDDVRLKRVLKTALEE